MYAETEHLIIRDPVADDWGGAMSFLSDAEVMRWIHLGPKPFDEPQAQRWIADLIVYNSQQPRDSHNCVIVERATEQVIGWVGIGKPSPHRLDSGDLDFGYALARECWGKGYMTEVLRALLTFSFTELGAKRVFAICETQNLGSYRVMEKAGMQRTQQFSEYDADKARTKQMYLYTISKEAWLDQSRH